MHSLQSLILSFLPSTHGVIWAQMKELNYDISSDGICAGLTQMWMQAIAIDEEDKFIQRLSLLLTIPANQLPNLIDAAKNKVKTKSALRKKERDTTEIMPFFDGVKLAQEPQKHAEIFGEKLTQENITKISNKTTSSVKLEEKGLLVPLMSQAGVFTEKNLNSYFKNLRNILAQDPTMRVPISLSCTNHRIGITYNNKSKQWHIFDANRIPFITYTRSPGKYIMKAFNERPVTAMHISLSTSAQTFNPEIKKELERLKQSCVVTAEMIEMRTNLGSSLPYMAATLGDIDTLKKLAACGMDLSKEIQGPEDKKITLLAHALNSVYPELIQFLKESGVNLNDNVLIDNKLHLPICLAAVKDDPQLIRIFKACGADINQCDTYGLSAISYAATSGKLECLQCLAMLGANLAATDANGVPPAAYAAMYNHPEILEYLSQSSISINQADRNGYTPSDYAANKGNVDVIPVLAKHGANFFQDDALGKSALRRALEKNHWPAVCCMLNTMPAHGIKELSSLTARMLVLNQDKLVDAVIDNIKKMPHKEQLYAVDELCNKSSLLGVILAKQAHENLGFFDTQKKDIEPAYISKIKEAVELSPSPKLN
ncbi:ankyrin repeat domain-containing protein [Legionella parisiensis]|uniref:Uncharacterized protein n=1 Tax=Legionella parisiensis TaxID=45071 RepID=A0A1E5JWV8_9GAMM|nr:ankyrin repeat domain-containing protein [Legionella parisiensis]KTD44373.1 Ankyrin repeats (3 copies) [Legionella parisiensis]OEH48970.1 hypothetical protein lpari_00022 [Legionella parisiensis]STX71999.1 Ribulose-5-phosphate 4-epimerase and related epimerases and aldolases [Legionella parisiensis]